MNRQANPDPYTYMKGDPSGWFEQDHHLWVELLNSAKQLNNEDLYDNLYGFRSSGTAIKKNKQGQYVLRPNVDGENKIAWGSVKQYRYFTKKFLKPYVKEVALLLKHLYKKFKEE